MKINVVMIARYIALCLFVCFAVRSLIYDNIILSGFYAIMAALMLCAALLFEIKQKLIIKDDESLYDENNRLIEELKNKSLKKALKEFDVVKKK
jgi:hypothetical protein